MLTASDKELHNEIFHELIDEPKVDAGAIGLAVQFGIVTLTGTVGSFSEKWAVEEAVKRVHGIRGIANELLVELPGMHRRTDTDIAQSAARLLEWNVLLPKNLSVEVTDGCVTLTGAVSHYYQLREAEESIHRLVGVRHIDNRIRVQPPPHSYDIHQKIAARFQRAATFDAENVQVEVNGSEVTLRGKVSSLREKDAAYYTAWNTPGVSSVKCLVSVG